LDIFAAGDANARDKTININMADIGSPDFLNDYFPDVIKAGQYEGKQLFVPLRIIIRKFLMIWVFLSQKPGMNLLMFAKLLRQTELIQLYLVERINGL